MKQIPLTQSKFALVDDNEFEQLNQHLWFAKKARNTWYNILFFVHMSLT